MQTPPGLIIIACACVCAFVFLICTSENDCVYGFAWPYVVHRMYSINRRTLADARPVLIHSGGANICLQLDSLN